jgi:2-polyprenyl-3-methyl-5-hydroxy-6-metoxy-1,4-benzoquinol methylase
LQTSSPYIGQKPCPCCGTTSGQIVSLIDGKSGGPLITLSCDSCGLGRIDPIPSEAELEEWYKNEYREAYKGMVNPALRYVLRAGRNALDRYDWFARKLNPGFNKSDDRRLKSLDIGASSGEFVTLMSTRGFDAKGIEPHRGYADYAVRVMGQQVFSGSLNEGLANYSGESFDVITMFHVLEHLSEPVKSLQFLGEQLSASGCLYIEVPNALRMCAPNYMFFKAHTLYFTHDSLIRLLAKAGFDVIEKNEPHSGNIRVIAQYTGREVAIEPVAESHALVAVQLQRKWGPYLIQQLLAGTFLSRLRTRMEEKREAGRFADGRALLASLYG